MRVMLVADNPFTLFLRRKLIPHASIFYAKLNRNHSTIKKKKNISFLVFQIIRKKAKHGKRKGNEKFRGLVDSKKSTLLSLIEQVRRFGMSGLGTSLPQWCLCNRSS